jgi:acyl-CoA synthetase (AMP-forming)/AMP-acid ligase II
MATPEPSTYAMMLIGFDSRLRLIAVGQRVAAVVQLSSGAGDAALGAILKDTRRQLADYKAPERLWAVDAVPRNTLGKVDRRAAAATAMFGRAA